jgi:hypothetical protein
MFGWIPFLGPIIDGIVSIFTKSMDTKVAIHRIDGSVDIEAMKASADLTKAFKDEIGVRLARDIVMFPLAIWTSLITWDNLVLHKYPDLVWTVEKFPGQLEYLPYAFITFLFGMAWINRK